MDLVPFGDLHGHISKGEVMTEYEVAGVLRSLLTAVNFLNDQGIIHRDIKPENILLNSKTDVSRVVLADFGLA
jgi:serine/threonine protein kinase